MAWKIGLLAAIAALWSGHASGAGCPDPEFTHEARAAIEAYGRGEMFSGAVLLAVDGQAVLRQGVGLAERELGVPAKPEMKFRIGSITKQFTATAILQLAEAGKLSLDDPISKYYADAPAAWAKITLRHLLTHTSGIPSYTALPGFFQREARLPHTPDELIKLTRDKPLEFEPGTQYAYDNSGYVLLGYVVEKVSGERYAEYLQHHIFEPLGMANTGYEVTGKILSGRASGYDRGPDGKLSNAALLDMSVPYAAGALYSTVDDLLLWDQALYGTRLLKADSLKAMFTDYGHHYGFGFGIDQKWGLDRLSHNGGINGFIATFQRYPKARITAVALANDMGSNAPKLAADLAGLCLGANVYPRQVAESHAGLARYGGSYVISPTVVVRLDARGETLAWQVPGRPDVTFYPQGGGTFFARTVDMRLAFQSGVNGQVTGLEFTVDGKPSTARRIDPAEADSLAQARAARAAAGLGAPGAEEALRRVIEELQRGSPDFSQMNPRLAEATRQQLERIKALLAPLGVLKSLTFKTQGPAGDDVFATTFEHGSLEWRIVLGAGGRIDGLNFRPPS